MQRTTINALVGAAFSLRREGIARKVDLGLVRLKIDIRENDDAFNWLLNSTAEGTNTRDVVADDNINAIGNPSAMSATKTFIIHIGASNVGNRIDAA